ncbi:endonuclease/exonuclease/phosphatase family protein [Aquimarina sp. 2201CG5-10]|uniref:endonuclease/exonuclease/phosphatase family protein n=1 Tax=Aquimarina callyspongiae TaxID=3098150 RepID=UPI002AB52999|nr:endonuclease/exonuclease/phosphatase family protein [Aquimarina sp. 2201CG5-10]MDY8137651.1 endonuclease/exonuclease/phosphatase family protein [Aquimarina sp. 2201CG5-10]
MTNSIAAFALLLSYLLPYVSPKTFPLLSVLSLAVPILIVINVLFLVYWAILLNKKVTLSLVVLILGFSHVTSLYKLRGKSSDDIENSVSLLSYNVHSFNRFDWIDSNTIPQDISKLVREQDPDVFCAQEYYNNSSIDFSQYDHKYEYFNHNRKELALVIFSKYPFVNKGSLNFKNTANNVIFADIVKGVDTVRVYNIHLQSHRISSKTDDLAKADSQKLLKRIGVSFKKQQDQAEHLITHMKSSPYKNIVMGDFNNTAYSYVYDKIKSENLQDTFKEAGRGFGKTFKFELFPARIDFILVSKDFEVLNFESFDEELSDHYPIYTRVRF